MRASLVIHCHNALSLGQKFSETFRHSSLFFSIDKFNTDHNADKSDDEGYDDSYKLPDARCFFRPKEPHGTDSIAGDILAAVKSFTSIQVQCTIHLLKRTSPSIFSEKFKSVTRLHHDRCHVSWIDVQGLHHCSSVLMFLALPPKIDGYSANSCSAVATPEDCCITFHNRVSCLHRDIVKRRRLSRVWGSCVGSCPPARGSNTICGRLTCMETCIWCAPPTSVFIFFFQACTTNAKLHRIANVIFVGPKFTARV